MEGQEFKPCQTTEQGSLETVEIMLALIKTLFPFIRLYHWAVTLSCLSCLPYLYTSIKEPMTLFEKSRVCTAVCLGLKWSTAVSDLCRHWFVGVTNNIDLLDFIFFCKTDSSSWRTSGLFWLASEMYKSKLKGLLILIYCENSLDVFKAHTQNNFLFHALMFILIWHKTWMLALAESLCYKWK